MRLALLLAVWLFVAACGSPRTDPFVAPPTDASTSLDTYLMDTNPCAAVEGQGCPCGSAVGQWRCVGTMPVCVCPTPADAGTPSFDAPPDVMRDPPDVAVPFPCATGSLYCASIRACVDVAVSRTHCGACDRACSSGQSCVRGACAGPDAGVADVPCLADVANDPANCGACGRRCETTAAHTRAVCRAGVCVQACDSRAWWNCNNDPLDGCESTDTQRDLCGCVCRDTL